MKNLPKKIYLQIDADGETPEDFKELAGITWCSERIYPTDIEYILNVKIRENGKSFCQCGFRSVSLENEYCEDCGKLLMKGK